MKMTKILCFVISLLLVMPLAATSVLASESATKTEETTEETKNIVNFLDSLGILKEFDAAVFSDDITRAEFIAITVITAKLPMIAMKLNFNDVNQNHDYYDYIAAAVQSGIVNATSESFEPDRSITYNEALKILVSALGYGTVAQARGGYPNGYYSIAREIGLTENVSSEKTVNHPTLYRLMYNFLSADLMQISSVTGQTFEYSEQRDKTLLTQAYDLEKISGVITTAGMATMRSEIPQNPEFVIENNHFKTQIQNASAYLGMNADLYYDKNKKAIAVFPDDNKLVMMDSDTIDKVSNNKLTTIDDNEKTYRLDAALAFVKNGRLIAHTSEDFLFADGNVTLIDNNHDNVYEVAIAEQIEYVVVGTVDLSRRCLYNKFGGGAISFEDTDGFYYNGIKHDPVTKADTPMSFEEIETGMLLELCQSEDGRYIFFTQIQNSIRGKITEKGEDHVVVDGTDYEVTDYFKNNEPKSELNRTYEFLLNSKGKIAYMIPNTATTMQYGFLINFAKEGSLLSKTSLKLVETSGSIQVYQLADEITLDGKKVRIDSPLIANSFVQGSGVKYQVIQYRLDSEGKIVVIDTATIPTVTDPVERYKKTDYGENSLIRNVSGVTGAYSSGRNLAPICSIVGTILYIVPENLTDGERYDENNFTVNTDSILKEHYTYKFDGYDFNDEMKPAVAVVYSAAALPNGAVALDDPPLWYPACVVESITQALDEDGEKVKKLVVVREGKFCTYYISEKIENAMVAQGVTLPQPGDIVRVSIKNENKIYGLSTDVQYNNTTGRVNILNILENSYTYRTYISGKAFAKGANSITILGDSYGSGGSVSIVDGLLTVALAPDNIVKFNRSTKKCQPIRMNDIAVMMETGEADAGYICVKTEYGKVKTLVLYTD